MKRTNLIVDEELLEKARRFSGERTYSAAVTAALKEYVRVNELKRALDAAHGMGDEAFAPGYLDWLEKRERVTVDPKRYRVSASERRLPKSLKRSGRGSR